jgi:hypothetical protein
MLKVSVADVVACPHHLGAAHKEVNNVQSQSPELGDELGGN